MREFTQTLQNIMSVVSNQLELLPASEVAVEEMIYVDEEERDDTRLSGDHLLLQSRRDAFGIRATTSFLLNTLACKN